MLLLSGALLIPFISNGPYRYAQPATIFSTFLKYKFSFCGLSAPVVGQQQMVVSAQALATEVGDQILQQGGNAVDAAVAMGYVLAATYPCCGNLGGGGFMLVHIAAKGQQPAKDILINFREKAPLTASKDMYIAADGSVDFKKSLRGYQAVGVPGTVMGLEMALQHFGSMSREQVMAPAIAFAEQGFILTQADVNILNIGIKGFQSQDNVAAIFLNKGKPFKAGELFVQKDLANSLKKISDGGSDAFYRGPIARQIVAASEANGGLLSLKDFEHYSAEALTPVSCNYRGYEVLSAPLPSSGGG